MGFSDQITAFVAETKQKMTDVAREAATEVKKRVEDRSPVDTGRFRGAWVIKDTLRSNGTISITNNTEYGPVLEDGSSDQAPNGMVGVTAAEWPGIVKEAVDRLR